MIRIEQLEFGYGDGEFHLRVPRLVVETGTTTALIGPSGSGKTTLLNLIAGIVLPDEGSIETAGCTVTELGDASRRNFRISNIGLVFQEFELLRYLSVLDNILLPYRINRLLNLDRTVRWRAGDLAKRLGLEDKLGRYTDQLSQGERQRVAVCRALLAEPKLLLADEPTGNLDPVTAGTVLDMLFEYVSDHGVTLLAVTHDHGLLERFERIIDFESFGADVADTGAAER